MSVTNLMGTTWVINGSNLANYKGTTFRDIIFHDENQEIYYGFFIEKVPGGYDFTYLTHDGSIYPPMSNRKIVISTSDMFDDYFASISERTITFVEGNNLTDSNLISFLSQNATQLIEYKTTNIQLGTIANAIREKGGISAPLVYPTGFVNAIEAIETGGGGSVASNAVNFRDYDGTIVAAYSAADFAALTAMPNNPSHDGLTAQGWNWSLADAKTYVAKYSRLEIGQMYITDDGKTRVYIHLEQGRTSPMLGCCPNGTVDVDWGDGTAHDTLTGTNTSTVKWTSNHAYAAPGDYVIKLTVTGSMGLFGSSTSNAYSGLLRYVSSDDSRNYAYRNAIKRVEIGSDVTKISVNAFGYCFNLANITIPNSSTDISSYAFSNCYNLVSVTIPDGVTNIGDSMFSNCSSLTNITIPDNVTSIGNYAFSNCSKLASITIPDGVTSIGYYAFSDCSSLASITIPDGVTSIGTYLFSRCRNFTNITIPDSVTSIGQYAFQTCSSLASVTIPDGVTSISNYAFSYCYSLVSVTIPDSVTSIGNSAFYSCYSVAEYHLTPTTPPTLSNANAFNGIPADCIIYVPYSADHSILEAYKTATNWSTYASKMWEE